MRRVWREPSPSDTQRFPPALVFEAGLRCHHISNTAYPIAHRKTWKHYLVPEEKKEEVAVRGWEGISDLCLYVHIPFCESRCLFCEYAVVKQEEIPLMEEYLDALSKEFDLYQRAIDTRSRVLHGFDIGGGTPAFIPADGIARIVEKARHSFQLAPGADISIETTPRIAAEEPEKIDAYRRIGINRISMGIQVTQPRLLKALNREANGIQAHRRAVEHIRSAGFRRLNIDLIYGLADQDLDSWKATLTHVVSLAPEYITLYRMRYKLTRISHQAEGVTLRDVQGMMKAAREILSEAGYEANPGKTTYVRRLSSPSREARRGGSGSGWEAEALLQDVGTSSYLKHRVRDGMPYLGLGLGAQSFTHTTISYNEGAAGKRIIPYLEKVRQGRLPIQDLYDLPSRQMMGKMCAVSFYFGEINLEAFQEKFAISPEEVFPEEVEFVLKNGLMEYTGRGLSLTPEGATKVNGVIALFFSPSIQQHLMELAFGSPAFGGPAFGGPAFGGPAFGSPAFGGISETFEISEGLTVPPARLAMALQRGVS